MSVDVSYHGVPLAQSAAAKADGDAAFVEIDAPMPVGTWLEVKTGGVTLRARVFKVNEGTQPGMTLRFADGKSLPPEAFVMAPSEMTQETSIPALMARDGEPNAPMAEMTSAPPVIEADASKREPTPEMIAEDARMTTEMPVLTMDAMPEDETSSTGAGDEESPPKDDDNGGRRKKKRPRKTVIGR